MATQVDTTTQSSQRVAAATEPRPEPCLFRVLDCARPLAASSRHRLAEIDTVLVGRGARAVERGRHGPGQRLVLTEPDGRISSRHLQLRRSLGRWLLEDLGSRNGTRVNGHEVKGHALSDGDLIEVGRTLFMFRDGLATAADDELDLEVDCGDGLPGMVTLHPPLRRDLRDLEHVAATTRVSIVIHGETGTGKELIARAVHALSRAGGPFVAVNCGALPPTLVEAELFGVRRGAYSDAREDRAGLVRSADGGTLFLDELGDLPHAPQAAFLRVLQEREVMPVGGARAVPVDVRVVCASHRRLDELAEAGRLRPDLWARLAGFTLALPPLRARREDLGLLAAALLRRQGADPEAVAFEPEAARALLAYGWPRNIRELEKCLGTGLALARGGAIGVRHLRDLPRDLPPRAAPAPRPPAAEKEAARRRELERLLGEHRGNVAAVARSMGKDRVQIRRWLRQLGLDPAQFR